VRAADGLRRFAVVEAAATARRRYSAESGRGGAREMGERRRER